MLCWYAFVHLILWASDNQAQALKLELANTFYVGGAF